MGRTKSNKEESTQTTFRNILQSSAAQDLLEQTPFQLIYVSHTGCQTSFVMLRNFSSHRRQILCLTGNVW